MPAGRPKFIDVEDMTEKLDEYIENTANPLIEEFLLSYKCSKARFYELSKDNEELADTIKRAIAKQEVYLQKQAFITPGAIGFINFKLKQPAFGWTDKQEITNNLTFQTDFSQLSDAELENRLNQLGYAKMPKRLESSNTNTSEE